jgi:hypothetical protein
MAQQESEVWAPVWFRGISPLTSGGSWGVVGLGADLAAGVGPGSGSPPAPKLDRVDLVVPGMG